MKVESREYRFFILLKWLFWFQVLCSGIEAIEVELKFVKKTKISNIQKKKKN